MTPEEHGTEMTPQSEKRQVWVEPAVVQLEVRETAFNPARGLDSTRANNPYPDCTRS